MILMALIFSRCFEQPDCLINNTNILKIALKGKTLGKDTTVRFTSIRALWLAENLYSNTESIGNILVPLNLKDTLTTVIFKYETKLGTVIRQSGCSKQREKINAIRITKTILKTELLRCKYSF